MISNEDASDAIISGNCNQNVRDKEAKKFHIEIGVQEIHLHNNYFNENRIDMVPEQKRRRMR